MKYTYALKALVGSRAYNLHKPTSDYDYRGFYVAPTHELLSISQFPPKQLEDKVNDICYWELNKFVKLAMACNPTVIEALYSHDIDLTEDGQAILNIRDKFLSKKAIATYGGYAKSQMMRFFQHQRQGQETSKSNWKNAMHMIRLLICGSHLLNNGEVLVNVDRHKLILNQIRNGEMTLEECDCQYRYWENFFRQAGQTTNLRETPDVEAIEKVVQQIRRRHYAST